MAGGTTPLFGLPAGSKITLEAENVFGFEPEVEVNTPGNCPALEYFAGLTPLGLLGAPKQFGGWLDNFRNSAAFATAVPLTDNEAFGQVLKLKDAWDRLTTSVLEPKPKVVGFSTLQDLQSLLNRPPADPSKPGISWNVSFNTTDCALEFVVSFNDDTLASESVDLGMSASLGSLSELAALDTSGQVDLAAKVAGQFTLGLDSKPVGGGTPIARATELRTLNSGKGVMVQVGLTATNKPPAFEFGSNDAVFKLTVTTYTGPTDVTVIVKKSDTTGNTTLDQLVADVNAALGRDLPPALSERIEAEALGDKIALVATQLADPNQSNIIALRVSGTPDTTGLAALGFDVNGQKGDRADLSITLSNGHSFEVDLDRFKDQSGQVVEGLTTLGQVLDAINGAYDAKYPGAGKFEVKIADDPNVPMDHLVLIERSDGTAPFRVKSLNHSMAGLAGVGLGIYGTADKADENGGAEWSRLAARPSRHARSG